MKLYILILSILLTVCTAKPPSTTYDVVTSGTIGPGCDELESYCNAGDEPLLAVGDYVGGDCSVVFTGAYVDKGQGSGTCRFDNTLATNEDVTCTVLCQS